MTSSDETVRLSNGADIFYRCWTPAEPRAVILLAHGLAEHSGRYDEFANFLADAGIATYVPDLPGHGKSDGERGYVRSFEEYSAALTSVEGAALLHEKVSSNVKKLVIYEGL